MTNKERLAQMLESYSEPAILVSKDYEIITSNSSYLDEYGELNTKKTNYCYKVSHGYSKPCDQSGEDCPLLEAKKNKRKERVLHIHETKNGREYVDVEMVPIFKDSSKEEIEYFVEILKPVLLANDKTNKSNIVGESEQFQKVLSSSIRAAHITANVLITGDVGTGKNTIAKLIHSNSKRSNQPYVIVDCPGIEGAQFEQEIYGYDKGTSSFTNMRMGLAEHAQDGTLLIDQIDDLSLQDQAKLLRLIETKAFKRLGSTKLRYSDFRLICTTSSDLTVKIKEGKFRRDLFHRINTFPITLPNLSERVADIPNLVEFFLEKHSKKQITQGAINILKIHHYDGNISELRNILMRAIALCDTNLIDENIVNHALKMGETETSEASNDLFRGELTLSQMEQKYLNQLLVEHSGDKKKVAEIAGISIRSLYRKIEA